ncbi:hypothetical protein LX15_001647 [Streptoalloteichus tenebrarius]|uniref:Uncharacterized protein n=1 Tax=Streptoalloteichus tenebrarius (strain ATCC 17920 / DSM 40477 / JCM 4838 / CBS 697.72 / NBRC 16177 / NCIMB 11028 / NRRL B-12390 / A12253. 1 / ISP 5477) TaxID=1933 RepID=A0ABT1HR90_STRSD|nr:hypothetical protein [Streptoalloteichus tenebrarius]MCP2257960.1 hypothetical protein [Streptoalloteichus tenebrarius]BFF01623.1 hypothetical protein GCM10020241_32980 [Streptoalloteichus tenebrarius]
MKIRLEGTQNEIAAAAVLIARVLNVREVSRFYPNHGESTLGRVYLTVGSPVTRSVRAEATRLDRRQRPVRAEATRLDRPQRPALPGGESGRDGGGGA